MFNSLEARGKATQFQKKCSPVDLSSSQKSAFMGLRNLVAFESVTFLEMKRTGDVSTKHVTTYGTAVGVNSERKREV